MFTLAAAITFASVLGSLHCIGMCGPFAIWATTERKKTTLCVYHLGRLTTYLSAGLVAGVAGTAVSIGGDLAGLQSLAAKVAGVLLVCAGLVRLLQLVPRFQSSWSTSPSWIAGLLRRAKPILADHGPHARAYFAGLLTTWLPCGWLYLFVLVAAGTGAVVPALVVMTSFWVGTLPALTGLVLGVQTLAPRFRKLVPAAAGLLLILVGLYTASGRASADLSSMSAPELPTTATLTEQPLPCCSEE